LSHDQHILRGGRRLQRLQGIADVASEIGCNANFRQSGERNKGDRV